MTEGPCSGDGPARAPCPRGIGQPPPLGRRVQLLARALLWPGRGRGLALRAAAAKAQLDVVMVEPFGAFVDARGLPCYTHACWACDKRTFDATTLTHAPHATTPTVTETAEALEYSRDGHWVVVLCQRRNNEYFEVRCRGVFSVF